MQFEILKDPTRIAKRRAEIAASGGHPQPPAGALVRYEMPGMPLPFPKLSRLLDDSKHRQQFLHIYYYLETKGPTLRQLVPAAEYYKLVFRAVADKLYSIRVGFGRVRDIEAAIIRAHGNTRITMPRTNQPSINVLNEVYALKTEVASVLFNTRAVLDTIASLLHFLNGPRSNQFVSFADYVKHLNNRRAGGKQHDEEMQSYISTKMGWLDLIRDLRDYVTHCGSLDVAFYEDDQAGLRIWLQNVVSPRALVNDAVLGTEDFCKFVDKLFAERIAAADAA